MKLPMNVRLALEELAEYLRDPSYKTVLLNQPLLKKAIKVIDNSLEEINE